MTRDDTDSFQLVDGRTSDTWAVAVPAELRSTGSRLVILSDITAEVVWEAGSQTHGGRSVVPADFEAQAYAAFENLTELLSRAGTCVSRMVAVRCRVCDSSEELRLKRICDEYVDAPGVDFTVTVANQPAIDPRCLLAVSAVAVL